MNANCSCNQPIPIDELIHSLIIFDLHTDTMTNSPPLTKIDTLTSLRFFAALAVVLFHIPGLMPSVYGGQAFAYMNTGVDFFFVLSGYVLAVTYSGSRD